MAERRAPTREHQLGGADRYAGAVLAAISYPPIPIWHVGPVAMSLHGLFAAIGFIAGGALASRRLGRRGFDVEAYQSVLSWAIVGAILGARYFTSPAAIIDGVPLLDALHPLRGNFSIMGGFAGGILAGWWRMRQVDLPRLPVFDESAFGLALGTVVGRIGDLAIVEHLGSATDVPWGYGIKPGYDVAPQHDALECVTPAVDDLCGVYHHVAAYDLLGAALLLGVLYLVVRRFRLHYGQLFWLWVTWYGLQRFVLDALRVDNGDRTVGAFTWNQLSGLTAALFGVALFLWFRRKPEVTVAEDARLNPIVGIGDTEGTDDEIPVDEIPVDEMPVDQEG